MPPSMHYQTLVLSGRPKAALGRFKIDLFTMVFDSCGLPGTAPCTAALGYLHSNFRSRIFNVFTADLCINRIQATFFNTFAIA